MTKTLKVFCAAQQAETDYVLDIDGNGEIVLTCSFAVGTEEAPQECGRTLKFPAGTDAARLKELLDAHKAANEGQVSAEAIEAKKKELLDALAPDEESST